jgi:glycosyltransferase involved in cell wall biosynthesis
MKDVSSDLRVGIDLLSLRGRDGGFERYARTLLEGLAEVSEPFEFVVFKNESFELKESIVRNFQDVVSYHLPRKTHFLANQVLLAGSRRKDLDVLHSPVSAPILFSPESCRYVVTVHDLTFEYFPQTMEFVSYYYWKYILQYGLGSVDKVIAISESTKKDLINLYNVSHSKIHVVYNSLMKTRVDDKMEPDVGGRYSRCPYFLHVGTVEPRKNLVRLVDAFSELESECDGKVRLIIAGKEGWGASEVKEEIRAKGVGESVEITGYVSEEELERLYRGAMGFVFPSLYEGFGYPPLEAMIYETPVICSNSSSLPEIVGDAALMVDPYDTAALKNAMARVLDSQTLRRRLVAQGKKRVDMWDSKQMHQGVLSVYKSVVKN